MNTPQRAGYAVSPSAGLVRVPITGRTATIQTSAYCPTFNGYMGPTSGSTTRTWINGGHLARILTSGVDGVAVWINDKTYCTSLQFVIYRWLSGTATPTFTQVALSSVITGSSLTSAPLNTIAWGNGTGALAQPGDFLGVIAVGTAAISSTFIKQMDYLLFDRRLDSLGY